MKSPIRPARSEGRLNLFFVEMIIVLLFFGIASAVILRTFAAAGELSRESGILERMSFCAQSAAELYSETGSLPETAEKLFGIEAEDASKIVIPLDEKCGYSPAEAELYLTMTVTDGSAENLSEISISFSEKDGDALYEIRSGAYLPEKEEGGNER